MVEFQLGLCSQAQTGSKPSMGPEWSPLDAVANYIDACAANSIGETLLDAEKAFWLRLGAWVFVDSGRSSTSASTVMEIR
jgi:hypothetical protein